MADISSTLRAWSGTAASNNPSGSTNIGAGLDDNLRELQAVTRKFLAGKGTAIASAATMDLTTMDAYYASVTGNTTVTGLGTEAAGISYYLRTASTPMFKHGAAAIVLPSAADLTAAAGDIFRFTSEGSGVWVLSGFVPAGLTGTGSAVRHIAPTLSGANLGSSTVATTQSASDNSTKVATTAYVDRVSASIVLIGATTAANVAAVDFTSGITSTYDEYLVTLTNIVPATDGQSLVLRYSDDGGSTFKAGASDYEYQGQYARSGAITVLSAADSYIFVSNATSNTAADGGVCGEVRIFNPSSTTQKKLARINTGFYTSATSMNDMTMTGRMTLSNAAITAFRFLFTSGNITSGNFALYGIKKV